MEIIIKNNTDILEFRKNLNLRNKLATIKIEFAEGDRKQIIEEKINKLYNCCGCQEGTIGIFLGILFLILFYQKIDINKGVLVLTTLFLAGSFGKIVGLSVAKYRLLKFLKILNKLN